MRDYKNSFPVILKNSFADLSQEASDILSCYNGQELERVWIGIIRLSNGDLIELKKWVDFACTDYRDLLMCAEYWLSGDLNLTDEDKKYARLEEEAEYDAWFNKMKAV